MCTEMGILLISLFIILYIGIKCGDLTVNSRTMLSPPEATRGDKASQAQ
jgi:hypothetical protein